MRIRFEDGHSSLKSCYRPLLITQAKVLEDALCPLYYLSARRCLFAVKANIISLGGIIGSYRLSVEVVDYPPHVGALKSELRCRLG
jgi:hypothetical protein